MRTVLKEPWEQKPDRCGFRGELEGKWNVQTGNSILNKPLREFCTGVQRNRIIAGGDVEPKEVFVFILCDVEPKEGRRGMCVCVSGKNRKMYLLEDIIEGPDLFRVEGRGIVPVGGTWPSMGTSSSQLFLLLQRNKRSSHRLTVKKSESVWEI